MKKTIIIALLALVGAIAQAQRFEWAKGFETDDHEIVGGVTDSLGNLYILSFIDASSSWDGEALIPSPVKGISKDLTPQVLIAKISPEGEMVWRKIIVSNPHGSNVANDIKKVGDSAFACLINFTIPKSGYTYYLDTLIIGASDYPIDQHYFRTGTETLYLVFDFDGNVLEQHFLDITYTDADGNDACRYYYMDSIPWLECASYTNASFDIDCEGNIYVSRQASDEYYDSGHNLCSVENGAIGGLKFWVDRRLAGEYRIEGLPYLWHPQILKFSPHFDTLLQYRYIVQKNEVDVNGTYYTFTKTDAEGNVYHISRTMVNEQPNTLTIDSTRNLNVVYMDHHRDVSYLVKFDSNLVVKYLITLDDSVINPDSIGLFRGFNSIDFDKDSNLLFLSASTVRGIAYDTNSTRTILTYHGVPLAIKSKGFFMSFYNNDTVAELHSYGSVPSIYTSQTQFRSHKQFSCKNNRVLFQSDFEGGVRFPNQQIIYNSVSTISYGLTVFDYSGRVIGGIDYNSHGPTGIPGPVVMCDSIVYLCNGLPSNARFGDIDFYVTGFTNCIAKYVDTALMHPYVWNPAGIGAAQAVQPKVYPVPATDMLHFVVPQGTATKAVAISVLGNKTTLPTKGNSADVSALAPGTYILEISNGKAKYYSKFIKQ